MVAGGQVSLTDSDFGRCLWRGGGLVWFIIIVIIINNNNNNIVVYNLA
jgi:hypothetical protein